VSGDFCYDVLMKKYFSRVVHEGDDEILLIPDEIGFGIGVDVIIERRGDTLTIRRKQTDVATPLAPDAKG
jgi:hypothetical protein